MLIYIYNNNNNKNVCYKILIHKVCVEATLVIQSV